MWKQVESTSLVFNNNKTVGFPGPGVGWDRRQLASANGHSPLSALLSTLGMGGGKREVSRGSQSKPHGMAEPLTAKWALCVLRTAEWPGCHSPEAPLACAHPRALTIRASLLSRETLKGVVVKSAFPSFLPKAHLLLKELRNVVLKRIF